MTEPWRAPLRTRTLILTGFFASVILLLVGRLAYIQIVKHEDLLRLAERQHSKTIPLRSKRGPIVDRTGHSLAVSGPAESLFAEPGRIEDTEALSWTLAEILKEPKDEIQKKLTAERSFVWVKRKLPPAASQAIKALKAPGLGFVQESLRLYPNRELAAHALGFTGVDGKGLEGIEQAYESHLAGRAGAALVGRDALGRKTTGSPVVLRQSVPGQGVVLTLDSTIQYVAEREVEAAWRRTQAKSAVAVVQDPRTGEVLALAVRPTFNPNSFATATGNEWRNRAVTDPFEPGSTFKAILAAAALEEGVVSPTDRFYGEGGQITVASHVIHDWKSYGWLTLSEVLQNSSNVGAIKVGLALGKERYYRYVTAFGFGSLTGVGLPGESRGRVWSPERWSGLSLATISIGQEVSVTALQIVAAFSAVANGGLLMQPRIVRALQDGAGREAERFEPRAVRRVISQRTARTLTEIMTRVVSDGTGRNAAIPGYDVAGKTGTAQKMNPLTKRYSKAPGVLSFVGFTPADDPRITMLVLLDEPKSERWGSEAAAPIFSAIGREILRSMDVPPKDAPPVQVVSSPAQAPSPRAERSTPGVARATGVALAPLDDEGPGAQRMPNLVGRSLREALATLAFFDVPVEVKGRGVVVAQWPASGDELQTGTVCRLELAPPTGRL